MWWDGFEALVKGGVGAKVGFRELFVGTPGWPNARIPLNFVRFCDNNSFSFLKIIIIFCSYLFCFFMYQYQY